MDVDNKENLYIMELYSRQKSMLEEYCGMLENERTSLERGESAKLEYYAQLDRGIVGGMDAIDRCVRAWFAEHDREGIKSPELSILAAQVDGLLLKAKNLVEENKILCASKMSAVQSDLNSVKTKTGAKSPFTKIGDPSIIDFKQ